MYKGTGRHRSGQTESEGRAARMNSAECVHARPMRNHEVVGKPRSSPVANGEDPRGNSPGSRKEGGWCGCERPREVGEESDRTTR